MRHLSEDGTLDSLVDWFYTEVKSALARGISAARATYDSTGNIKLARMHGGAAIGKWYAANTIYNRGPSIELLLKELQPHNIELPAMLGTSRQREDEGYSNSKNLRNLITDIIPVLAKRGFTRQASGLAAAVRVYLDRMAEIELEHSPAPDVKVSKKADSTSAQASSAERMIMDIIKQLPKDIQGDVRSEVARRGNTLQALKTSLDDRGISL